MKILLYPSQHQLYVLLKEEKEKIDCLCFNFSVYKYGYPNDEVGHPLMRYGLGFYGFYEVKNSAWIKEMKDNNRSHPMHDDSLYSDYNHYIIKFKDVTLEIISKDYKLRQVSKSDLLSIVNKEIGYLR